MFYREMKDHCGVFGYSSCDPAMTASMIYYGLFALQHRGQESCGIALENNGELQLVKKMGLVSQALGGENLGSMKGYRGIGHVRYSTAGTSCISDAQPLSAEVSKPYTDFISLAHNGNITNAGELRLQLKKEGMTFQTKADTEVILNLIARTQTGDLIRDLKEALSRLRGAFSLLILVKNRLIAVRDPHGVRPLVLGKKDDDWVVASETCALDIIRASFVREIAPGEIVVIENGNISCSNLDLPGPSRQCVFELIYFSRPDSFHFGTNVHMARKRMGQALAQSDKGLRADFVIAVPDSGIPAALGYSDASGIPYERGFTRNHYIGRSFIHPLQDQREMAVKVKLNPVFPVVNKRDLIVIDDSLVRGTTCRLIVKLLKDFGAKSVHLRFASPPVCFPCIYGIDTPDRNKLLAANYDIDGIKKFIGADSVAYLEIDKLRSCQECPDDFCYACFTGNYFDSV
ncbi:MAG: amidophosphoribosyltransferase [Candidatus Wallbacteria bacterium]|nr:amidophosphoribosyltransferase [Candidatus Wallbacteria bacterium]